MSINFKRIFSLLAALCLCTVIAFTGCQKQGEAVIDTPSASPTADTGKSDEPKTDNARKTVSRQTDSSVNADWTEIDSYAVDIDGDKAKEKISLFVDAQKDADGELQKNDGQRWVLRVTQNGEYYTLFNEYVQNGSVCFEVADYYSGSKTIPTVTLVKTTGAEFKVMQYGYDKDSSVFYEETVFDSSARSDGGINRRYSNIGNIK